ncbi:hypothetical protein C8J56DRAFT_800420, partial [Mycena floridula]
WTIKALNGGKHALVKKSTTDTADEAERIFALAKEKGLIVLEAFHYCYVSLPDVIQLLEIFLISFHSRAVQHI